MRWPWRTRNADQLPSTGAGVGAPPPPPRDAWRTLPPLQRTTREQESACHLDTFRTTLSTHQDPRFLESLAHYVAPNAPAGEVEGLARPVMSPATEFSRPLRAALGAPDTHNAGPSVHRIVAPDAAPRERPDP